jgi:hypothetical protein
MDVVDRLWGALKGDGSKNDDLLNAAIHEISVARAQVATLRYSRAAVIEECVGRVAVFPVSADSKHLLRYIAADLRSLKDQS